MNSRRLPPSLEAWSREQMNRALDIARATPGCDVPVGAILLGPTGQLLGQGHNERVFLNDPTAHAEIQAIRAAAQHPDNPNGAGRLDDCTLIVTLEPCTMCAGAILGARIKRLIFGAWEPKTGACGSIIDVIRDAPNLHRPEVIAGVEEEACAALLSSFFAHYRLRH